MRPLFYKATCLLRHQALLMALTCALVWNMGPGLAFLETKVQKAPEPGWLPHHILAMPANEQLRAQKPANSFAGARKQVCLTPSMAAAQLAQHQVLMPLFLMPFLSFPMLAHRPYRGRASLLRPVFLQYPIPCALSCVFVSNWLLFRKPLWISRAGDLLRGSGAWLLLLRMCPGSFRQPIQIDIKPAGLLPARQLSLL